MTNKTDTINVIIEIPAQSEPIKYEVDKDSGLLCVDRFMGTAMHYPANYGYIPDTLSDDGDPADVLVVTPIPVRHGAMIKCRPLGMLKMTDESGVDAKIIAVPTDKISQGIYSTVKSIDDLQPLLLKQIVHFFEHYKDLEEGKWVKVDGWASLQETITEIEASFERCQNG